MPHVMCFGATPRPPLVPRMHRSSDRLGTLAPSGNLTDATPPSRPLPRPRAVPPCRADQPECCCGCDHTIAIFIRNDSFTVTPALFFSHIITHPASSSATPSTPVVLSVSSRYQTVSIKPTVIRHATFHPPDHHPLPALKLTPHYRLHRVISINGNQQ